MMSDQDFQRAFVLHTRAYRNTSLLVELFTESLGRLTLVARGAKRPKSPWKGLLQPFMPIAVRYVGKHELKTLCDVESRGMLKLLTDMRLWCGLYVNEILMKVLHQFDPHPDLFLQYHDLLLSLSGADELKQQQLLRRFEMQLLKILGYQLQIEHEAGNDQIIQADAYYHYLPEFGLQRVARYQSDSQAIFSGKHILAIYQDDLHDELVLRDAKKLLRLAMSPLLNYKSLKTPQMLTQQFEVINDD